MKIILHIDINAFFSSVEELHNPSLLNKPVVVSNKTKRSVVCSANYIARAMGVKAAMPVFEAKQLCRNLLVVSPNFEWYEMASHEFERFICEKFSNKLQMFSLDECFVDVTRYALSTNASAIAVAHKVQKDIKDRLGLGTSIGIAATKFYAKMGSDFKKPMGITDFTDVECAKKLLADKSVDDLLFVGRQSTKKLKAIGVNTIGEFCDQKVQQKIHENFGDQFDDIINNVNGMDDDNVVREETDFKSISTSETFLNNTNDYDEIRNKLYHMCTYLHDRLRESGQSFKTISLTVKFPDFTYQNRSYSYKRPMVEFENVCVQVTNMYENNFLHKTIRLIGVGLSNLRPAYNYVNTELFDNFKEKEKDLNVIIKSINEKFGKDIIKKASKIK